MPGSTLYEFLIPAPHTGSFTNGEKAISVASNLNSVSGRSTFYISRWFDSNGGQHTLRSVAVDAATWIVSVSKGNGHVVHSSGSGDAVADRLIYLPPGRHRIDIILSNVSIGTSSCWLAFGLAQDGKLIYASAADGWVWSTFMLADDDLPAIPDVRLGYPVFSVIPNWKTGITERLEWKTEVLGSESDVEQRRSLRRYPRRSFEMSFMRNEVRRARLDHFFTGVGKNRVLLPLWHEQYRLPSTLSSSVTFTNNDGLQREFKPGDLAWVNAGDPQQGEILQVNTVTSSTLTFTGSPVGSWPAGSRIVPLRVARLMESAQASEITDAVATAQARFTLDDPDQWPTPATFSGAPVFDFLPNRSAPIAVTFDRPTANVMDNEIGKVDVLDIFARTRIGTRLQLTLFGRSKVYALRRFLAYCRGRAVRFWMPTFMRDITPSGASIGGNYIDAIDAGFTSYMQRRQDSRRALVVQYRDGRADDYRDIISVSKVGGFERFFVDVVLDTTPTSMIKRIAFVMPVRFDQDGFELQHETDDSAAVQTTLVFRSSDTSGMDPLE